MVQVVQRVDHALRTPTFETAAPPCFRAWDPLSEFERANRNRDPAKTAETVATSTRIGQTMASFRRESSLWKGFDD